MAYETHNATILCYDNRALRAYVDSISNVATLAAGHNIEHLLTENPYRSVKWASGVAEVITYDFNGTNYTFDCWGIIRHNIGSVAGNPDINLEYWDGGAWQTVGSTIAPTDDWDLLLRFEAQTSDQWRVTLTGNVSGMYIGNIFLGTRLLMGYDGGNQPVQNGGFETTHDADNLIVKQGAGSRVNVNPSVGRIHQDGRLKFSFVPFAQMRSLFRALFNNQGAIVGVVQPDQGIYQLPNHKPHFYGWLKSMKDRPTVGSADGSLDVQLDLEGV